MTRVNAAKVYWSRLSPEERKTEATKRARKRAKTMKANRHLNGKAKHNDSGTKDETEKHIWYLFGKVETITELYSASAGVPRATLAAGLSRLLRHQEGG